MPLAAALQGFQSVAGARQIAKACGRTALALEEDPAAGGGTNAHGGPTPWRCPPSTPPGGGNCNVNVEAASNNPDVTTDTDGSPRTNGTFVTGG